MTHRLICGAAMQQDVAAQVFRWCRRAMMKLAQRCPRAVEQMCRAHERRRELESTLLLAPRAWSSRSNGVGVTASDGEGVGWQRCENLR